MTSPSSPPLPTTEGAKVPFLEARDVKVHYGGVKALDGLSLTVWTTGIVGLLGPNGSGKSTFLGSISGLVRLTGGSLTVDGVSIASVSPHRVAGLGIARTFQTVRLVNELSVAENVQLGVDLRRRAQGRRGPDRRNAGSADPVGEALAMVGLEGFQRAKPSELSYGYQRRVEMARALAMGPRLLLLDEPTAGMSPSERADVSELLLRVSRNGIAIMLIEHDVQMMVDCCDYMYAINSGRLLTEGDPEAVVKNPAVQEAYLGKQ